MMRVVLYGSSDGPCPHYRARMFEPYWREAGIEVRWVHGLRIVTDRRGEPVGLDGSAFDGADVVVLRRYYSVEDPFGSQDWITDSVIPWLAAQPFGILWDVDDDLFSVQRSNAYHDEIRAQLPQIRTLARMADLVTVSTPELAKVYAPLASSAPRVIRNAIELERYTRRDGRPSALPPGRPTVAYFGMGPRMLDLLGERGYPAQALAEQLPRIRTVYLGVGDGGRAELGPMSGLWHDVRPGVPIDQWPDALSAIGADVGLAPLEETRFAQGRSELHWLEWTAAGAATIASRIGQGGPYAPAKGAAILARGRSEWSDGLRRLVDSSELRAELVGRSTELARRDYDPAIRAREWIDAFRWTAEHAGAGARSAAA